MNTVTAVCGPGHDLPEKDHIVTVFSYGHIEIADPTPGLCQFGQFMVMGGELGTAARFIMQKLRHRPGDGKTVKCTGTTANLIQDHQTATGGMAQNIGRLHHLHHKCTLSA